MLKSNGKLILAWIGTALAIILVDQVTKYLASQHLAYGEGIEITSFFFFTLAHNTGAAFSLLANAGGWQRWFFVALGVIVAVSLVIWMYRLKPHEKLTGWSLALVLGGALGNVIDRVVFGYVIDFIDVYLGSYRWPAFNVADSAICVGAVILVVQSLFSNEEQKDSSSSST